MSHVQFTRGAWSKVHSWWYLHDRIPVGTKSLTTHPSVPSQLLHFLHPYHQVTSSHKVPCNSSIRPLLTSIPSLLTLKTNPHVLRSWTITTVTLSHISTPSLHGRCKIHHWLPFTTKVTHRSWDLGFRPQIQRFCKSFLLYVFVFTDNLRMSSG